MTNEQARSLVRSGNSLSNDQLRAIIAAAFEEITTLRSFNETADRRIRELEKMAHPPTKIPFDLLEKRVEVLEAREEEHPGELLQEAEGEHIMGAELLAIEEGRDWEEE